MKCYKQYIRTYVCSIYAQSNIQMQYKQETVYRTVSGSLISPVEPLAIGYFVAPSKEKIYKIKLKVKVKLTNKHAQVKGGGLLY